jgi:hypothetical protein
MLVRSFVKLTPEALNFGIKMNGGTNEKWEKENEIRSSIIVNISLSYPNLK